MAQLQTKVPYVNKENSAFRRLLILVVSSAEFTDSLKEALLAENKLKYNDKLQFVFCEHVEDVLVQMELHSVVPDYIVIVLNPRFSTCLQIAEDNISKIDSMFIEAGRLCIVNGACGIRPAQMGTPLGNINVISQKYSVILINGDVLKPEKCRLLASRILHLSACVCGYFTGVPISVDVSGYDPSEY